MHAIHRFVIPLLLLMLAMPTAAWAVVHHVVLGTGYAAASSATPSTAQAHAGTGSWWKLYPGAKAELYISPDVTFGTPLFVSDIASVTYHTRNHASASPVEYFFALYTRGPGSPPYAHGFYEQRLNAEPYLKTVQPYTATYDVWNAWTTGGADPLTFTDHNNAGNAGFYNAPTLAQVQAGPVNWSTWPGNPTSGTANPAPINYASQRVLYLSFQTGSGWSVFDGYLDDITVNLTNGDSYVVDLEAAVDPLYVDDDWAAGGIGSEVAPGRFLGYNAFAKVQDAVNAAIPGGTIHVAPGTYVEQVVVNGKDVSILGSGRLNTILRSPALLTASFTTSAVNKPVVFVQNTPNVIVRDVQVDANGAGNANNRIQGVAFWNAGGKLIDSDVLHVRNTPFDGVQAGVGVFGGTNTGGPYHLEVSGCQILDFQKNGTVFTGAGYDVLVASTTVTGAGATAITAQNGIQVSFGATATLSNNNVTGIYYTGPSVTATGQLLFASGPVSVSGGSVNDCQTGTYFIDTDGSMTGTSTLSSVTGGIGTWGVATYNQSATIVSQAGVGEGVHTRPVPSAFDDDLFAVRAPSRDAVTSFTVNIDGGCITGPGTPASEGIELFTEGGGMNVSITHAEITNWGHGILADGTVAGPVVSATHNRITGNVTAGYTAGLGSHTAELDWWGNAGGPGVGGANGVSGSVDTSPWLIAGTDLSPGCGFSPPADNAVAPVSPPTCITPAHACVDVPVQITRTTADGLRGFSVDVLLSAGLTLCAPVDEGDYLSNVGLTQFQVLANGGGSYTIDGSILGLPCGATAATGTLFTLHLGSALPSGSGSVTVTSVILRDCNNGPVPASAGAPALLDIDNTAPVAIAALAAAQRHTGNDGDGTTKLDVSWPAVEAGASVEVYRKGFGFYPEYDDAGGAVPAIPSYPPAGWTLAGTVTGLTALADEPPVRDFWYYVAFVRDACGNVSAVSNRTGGTLDYHLGDVQPVAGPVRGNNVVNTPDVSDLGLHYGVSLAFNDPLNYLDVGPTTDFSVNARPTTDNRVQFEDLMMFAINYGQVSAPAAVSRQLPGSGAEKLTLQTVQMPAVGETFAVPVELSTEGVVKGVSVQLAYDPAVVEPAGVEAGALLAAQHLPSVVLSSQPGNLDAALLGTGEAIVGRGELARALFRVKAAGDPAIRLQSADARDRDNQRVALGLASGQNPGVAPARTALGPASPSPFRQETVLELSLSKAGEVSVDVFDLSGRHVANVLSGNQPAGVRLVRWNGQGNGGQRMSAGVYLIRLQSAGLRQTRRVFLVP